MEEHDMARRARPPEAPLFFPIAQGHTRMHTITLDCRWNTNHQRTMYTYHTWLDSLQL